MRRQFLPRSALRSVVPMHAWFVAAAVLAMSAPATAQEHPPGHGEPAAPPHPAPLPQPAHAMEAMLAPLGMSLEQVGSGTSWQPPSTPMFGHSLGLGRWVLMLHYNAFAGLDVQGTSRGSTEAVGIGWAMGMLHGPLWGGHLTARVMTSPEPIFLGRRGYPLLLQTGETAFGRALVDRQHPHDLFMELSVAYARALTSDVAFQLYFAPAGEPALGPVAYPHRASAMPDPLAPLGHHWQDSSHITFGTITAALFSRTLKLEASLFNGAEPDEARFGLDLRRPDSASVRISAVPSDVWVLSGSFGFLREPELRKPGESLVRVAASASHYRGAPSGAWAATAVVGQNRPLARVATTSLLVETSLWLGRNVVFGRAEYVEKTAHDFELDEFPESVVLPVTGAVVGYARELGTFGGVVPAIGVRLSMNAIGEPLSAIYGTTLPLGGAVYLWVRPEAMRHGPPHP